jgi:hypothetical protein
MLTLDWENFKLQLRRAAGNWQEVQKTCRQSWLPEAGRRTGLANSFGLPGG